MSGAGGEVGAVLLAVAEWQEAINAYQATDDPALEIEAGWRMAAAEEHLSQLDPEHLRALAAQAEAGADVRGEWEVMKAALVSIRDGSRLSEEWFKSRLGGRKSPTWYAVNALQDNTGAAYHTAREALSGISPEPAASAQASAGGEGGA